MGDQALQKVLGDYNRSINNNYQENWGSLLSFMRKLPCVSD